MRPPALDDFKRREVLALLAHGVSRRAAAEYVCCAPNTILNAFRGDDDFRAAVLKAEAHCETHCLAAIREAGSKHWRAAAWFLERRFPKRYGKRILASPPRRANSPLSPPRESGRG